MLAAIVGGRLQGLELACLAQQAGWRTLVVDRKDHVPAKGIGDQFLQLDVTQSSALNQALADVDFVVPALENQKALKCLSQWGCEQHVPVAFDPAAYAVSSSKRTSNRLFASLGIQMPEPWPQCGFPIVVKPSQASGSDGVVVLKNEGEADVRFPHGLPDESWVAQQYIDGPSFSLEVIGRPGRYAPLQITELFMDAVYDCKRVVAPCRLPAGQRREIKAMGVEIAEAIGLTGLMDLEVILHDGCFKVLEIDARFPSQTPLAVYHSTGCNMFAMLADLYLKAKPPQSPPAESARSVILEHIRVTPKAIFLEGEHIMSDAGPLQQVSDFFGADVALTNYHTGANQWVATLIVTARSHARAEQKRNQLLADMGCRFNLDAIVDNAPESRP